MGLSDKIAADGRSVEQTGSSRFQKPLLSPNESEIP